MIRQRMRFYGDVQGVGFRWRARAGAENLGVTGWVKNEWDGSVTMEAQGSMEQLNRLLTFINRSSYIRISWLEREDIPVDPEEGGFHVR